MATCVVCNKSGSWFFTVNEYGICDDCQNQHELEMTRLWKIFDRAIAGTDASKTFQTRLKNYNLAISVLLEGKQYHDMGFPDFDADKDVPILLSARHALLIGEFNALLENASNVFKDALTDAGKLAGFNKLITKVREFNSIEGDEFWSKFLDDAKLVRDEHVLALKFGKAESALALGKKIKAKNDFLECLLMIKSMTEIYPNANWSEQHNEVIGILTKEGVEIPTTLLTLDSTRILPS